MKKERLFLKQLIEHMRWANKRTLTTLKEENTNRTIKLFAHIVTTEKLYFLRITGQDPWPQNFWPELSLEQSAGLIQKNYDRYYAFLEETPSEKFSEEIQYRNSKGITYQTVISEMFTHLALHGEHHRGQIAQLIRKIGGKPAVTDYITYTRKRK